MPNGVYEEFVSGPHTQFARSQPLASPRVAAVGSGLQTAVTNIVWLLKRSIIDRTLFQSEGEMIRSNLDQAELGPKDTKALFAALDQADVLDQFYQTAHPRWGPYVRKWLEEHQVPWSQIHEHYYYDLKDSLDFLSGFVFGMGVSLADLPIALAKLTSIVIDGKLAEEKKKFFDAIEKLKSQKLVSVLEKVFNKWIQEFDELIYQLQWFNAGQKLGSTLTNIALFGQGAAKLVASLPKFVKILPAAVDQVLAVSKRTASMAIATAQDAVAYLKAIGGLLFVVPDLRYSRLLPAILSPGDLRALMSGSVRVLTKSGFELVYVQSTKGTATVLRTGFLPSDFVSESYVVIRDGITKELKGRIYNPRSLAYALKDLSDDDIDGMLDVILKDADVPRLDELTPDEIRALAKKAMEDPKFARTVINFNIRQVGEQFAAAAAKRAQDIASSGAARPTAATFGTLVEGDMKALINSLQTTYKHLTFYRGESLTEILASRLPSGSNLLGKTVARYVQENQLLAKQIGFDGNNLSQVLAASGETVLGDLKVDVLIVDNFGHQGLLLDWTSFYRLEHFNKTMLYHAVISEVFPNMRLPFGEVYHFGAHY